MKNKKLLLFAAILSILLFAATIFAQEDIDPWRIQRGLSDRTPTENEFTAQHSRARSIILQFRNLPDADQHRALKGKGLLLDKYLGGNAYLVRKDDRSLELDAKQLNIRAILPYSSAMKLSPSYRTISESRRLDSGSRIYTRIVFSPHIGPDQIRSFCQEKNILIKRDLTVGMNAIETNISWGEIQDLSQDEAIDWLEPAPMKRGVDNIDVTKRNGVANVYKKRVFRNVDGSGVPVGIWDGGLVDKHKDLAGRVVHAESGSVGDHATAVAGIIASSGKNNSRAIGMAPRAKIYSYDFDGDIAAELQNAINKYGIKISNNSWGYVVGWHEDTDDGETINYWDFAFSFGQYDDMASSIDKVVANNDLLFVKSGGNDRNDYYLGPYKTRSSNAWRNDLQPKDPDYGSISSFGNSKNILTVGAIMKDEMMTGFSCWGPTDDGRIKPDVVATGSDMFTLDTNDQYWGGFGGTSASSPVASGVAALLIDYYKERHKSDISMLSLKNLLIHSARDLGKPGPDYTFGHGAVDGELGARVIRKAVMDPSEFPLAKSKRKDRDENMHSMIYEGTITKGKKQKFVLELPEGGKELRVSLVWHDQPGAKLVNDLDLWIKIKTDKKYSPFKLNPAKLLLPATTGTNKVDNVEVIKVMNPVAAKCIVYVKGSRVTTSSQKYSLIVSVSDGNKALEYISDGDMDLRAAFTSDESESVTNADPVNSFTDGDSFNLYGLLGLFENADYGNFYGTISFNFSIIRPNGKPLVDLPLVAGLRQIETNYSWIIPVLGYEIPTGLPSGNYKLEVTATLANGETGKKSYNFSIER